MNLREKVARAIAQAHTGHDPDSRILPFQPVQLGGNAVLLPPEDSIVPLWKRYLDAAKAAMAAMREEFEEANVFKDEREV